MFYSAFSMQAKQSFFWFFFVSSLFATMSSAQRTTTAKKAVITLHMLAFTGMCTNCMLRHSCMKYRHCTKHGRQLSLSKHAFHTPKHAKTLQTLLSQTQSLVSLCACAELHFPSSQEQHTIDSSDMQVISPILTHPYILLKHQYHIVNMLVTHPYNVIKPTMSCIVKITYPSCT